MGDFEIQDLTDQTSALCASGEIHHAVAGCACHEFIGVFLRGAFHQDLLNRAYSRLSNGPDVNIELSLQCLEAAKFDFMGGVVL